MYYASNLQIRIKFTLLNHGRCERSKTHIQAHSFFFFGGGGLVPLQFLYRGKFSIATNSEHPLINYGKSQMYIKV